MNNEFEIENIFGEVDKAEQAEAEVAVKQIEQEKFVPEMWKVLRNDEPLKIFALKDNETRETAVKYGKIMGHNEIVETGKKIFVCPETDEVKIEKYSRVIATNGQPEAPKPTVYRKFSGRRN